MKKITLFIFNLLLTCSVWGDNLTGKWNFDAPSAPCGFQSGTVEFKNVENKTVASIDFGHISYEFEVNQIDNDHYLTQIPVMGDEVTVSLDNTNGQMKTVVNAMGVDINVELSKLSK